VSGEEYAPDHAFSLYFERDVSIDIAFNEWFKPGKRGTRRERAQGKRNRMTAQSGRKE
jgi:hypothetical protein